MTHAAHLKAGPARPARRAESKTKLSAPQTTAAGGHSHRGSSCACGGSCPRCQAAARMGTPVTEANDAHEHQADAVADRVMAGTPVSGISLLSESGSVSRQARTGAVAPAYVSPGLAQVLSSDARALDTRTRGFMESRFDRDFGQVRVHTGQRAAASAAELHADAYTAGSHIVFADGAYQPESFAGRRLLAHELTHTLQQSSPGGPNAVQRNCRDNSDESFYSSAPDYCRDTGFTGMFHSDKTCYREVPVRSGYFECPPGDQVCFDEDGNCDDSFDEASPVESRDDDGSCNLHHACTWSYHTTDDVVPGLAEKATEPIAEWMSGLEREIYRLYSQ